MITAEMARRQLYKASILKADDLSEAVVDIFLDKLDSDEHDISYEIENMVSRMLTELGIKYEYVHVPESFEETLNNIMADFNYSVEAIYSFPELAKYKEHALFQKVMDQIECVYYSNNAGSGNLNEFVHLASSKFATSTEEHERQFALQDPTAFLLAIQDNGWMGPQEILNFLLELKHSIDYIAELTIN